MYIFQPDRFLLRKQVADLAEYVRGDVLDVGAGERARYRDLFTCDSYTRMDVAHGENVDVVGSAEAMPFDSATFDSVVCTQVFEHLPHPVQAANEIVRVLRPGGYVLVTVPQMNELHEEPHDYFRYSKYGLELLFTEAGMRLVRMEARGGFWTTLTQLKIRYITDLLGLYRRPFWGRVASKIFRLGGEVAFFLDRVDKSLANRVHTIGYAAVFKKL